MAGLICESDGGGAVSEQYAYRGPGVGAYERFDTITYVGEGQGALAKEREVHTGNIDGVLQDPVGFFSAWRCRWWFLFVVLFLLLVVVAVVLVVVILTGGKHKEARVTQIVHGPGYAQNDCFSQEHFLSEYCCKHFQRGCIEPDIVHKVRYVHLPPPVPDVVEKEYHGKLRHPEVIYKNEYREEKLPRKVIDKARYHHKYAPAPPPKVIYDKEYRTIDTPAPPPEVIVRTHTKFVEVPGSTLEPEIEYKYKYRYKMTTEPWDCMDGFTDWEDKWGSEKKIWCCANYKRGCPESSCKLWGDPHIITFDKSHLVFYSEGDFWIVKSDTVNIQGRFEATQWTKDNDHTDFSSMTAIVVAFEGKKLEVQTAVGKILCNGNEILQGFGSASCGEAQVDFDSNGQLVDSAMAFLPHKVVHVLLPHGIKIQINRWPNFINALIIMPKMHGGQDGVCGNYNGIVSDDSGHELHRRFGQGVNAHECLFSNHISLHVPKAKPSPKRCKLEDMDTKAKWCIQKVEQAMDGWSVAECMGDVCDNSKATLSQASEMKHHLMQEGQFDCEAGFSNWRMGWSLIKKTWCCHHLHKGCE